MGNSQYSLNVLVIRLVGKIKKTKKNPHDRNTQLNDKNIKLQENLNAQVNNKCMHTWQWRNIIHSSFELLAQGTIFMIEPECKFCEYCENANENTSSSNLLKAPIAVEALYSVATGNTIQHFCSYWCRTCMS